jgi:hypothetical protein
MPEKQHKILLAVVVFEADALRGEPFVRNYAQPFPEDVLFALEIAVERHTGNSRFFAELVNLNLMEGSLLQQQQKRLRNIIGNRTVLFDHHVTFLLFCHILLIVY